MCSTPGETFGWVAAILVNTAFIVVISWGAMQLWPVGFALSAIYTVFLFGLANWLEKRNLLQTEAQEQNHPNAEEEETDIQIRNHNHSAVLLSLMYALAVLATGVTGLFLPVNILNCSDTLNHRGEWKTNISSLPPDVQNWASDRSYWEPQSFAYIASTETVLFRGSDKMSGNAVLLSSNPAVDSNRPAAHKGMAYPNQFTSVSENTACFSTEGQECQIFCSDGNTFKTAKFNTDEARKRSSLSNFFASQGFLWFKQLVYNEGEIVYSMEPDTMDVVIHSYWKSYDDEHPKVPDRKTCHRHQTLGILFASAFPITVISILIWARKTIPSMGALTYIGFYCIFLSLMSYFYPEYIPDNDVFIWWATLSGGIWVMALAEIDLVATEEQKGPLRWGMNIGGISFLCGVLSFVYKYDTAWLWLFTTIAAFLPLVLLAISNDSLLLMSLGGIGFLNTAWRLAAYLGEHGGDLDVPIQFFVLATAGVGMGFLGFVINQHQERLKAFLIKLLLFWKPGETTNNPSFPVPAEEESLI